MKLLVIIKTFIKNHLIASIIIGVAIVGVAVSVPIIINNVKGDNPKVNENKNIELIDNLNIEINSDVFVLSLIKKISNIEMQTTNDKIDTSKLGKQEVVIKYLDNKKATKEYKFEIDIVDTTKPKIEYKKELTTTVGTKVDLLKNVKVTDNSKETIKATVEGTYDINKEGTYKLKYIAKDSSGNTTEEAFTLKVDSVKVKTTGYYVLVSSKTYEYFQFESKNKITYGGSFCDKGVACGGFAYGGTYVIKGNKIIATFTHYYEIEATKLDKPFKREYTLTNENQINIKNSKFKHQKNL